MTSDDVFVNGVWKKYNNYMNSKVQEEFFRKHQYKSIEIKRKLWTIVSFILGIIATTGVVYASIAIHNNSFSQQYDKTDFINNPGYQYYKDMQCSEGIYYKRIYSYDEYIKATNIWHNLVEMNEKDFQESFVLIIAGQSYKTTGLYISDIYVKDKTTYVELRRKEKYLDAPVISARVSKEFDCEDIVIKNLPNVVLTDGKYKEQGLITLDYSVEQALDDGCFVVESYGKIISEDKEKLDRFIEKKENDVLRIYKYGQDYFTIIDIEYINGIININEGVFNLKENKINDIIYFTGNKIEKEKINFNGKIYSKYVCSNEIEDAMIICAIKDN